MKAIVAEAMADKPAGKQRAKAALAFSAAAFCFFFFASNASASAPIFQMADGSWYHPPSGTLAPTKEAMLEKLGLADQPPDASNAKHQMSNASSDPTMASNLRSAVEKARAELQRRADAWHASGAAPKRVGTYDTFVDITLAVWNSRTGRIEYVDARKNGVQMNVVTPVPYGIRVARTNGVNSQYAFDDDGERVVVAVYYPIFRRVEGMAGWYDLVPVVYTPWSKRIHEPEIVEWGKATLIGMLNDVYGDLRARGVRSLAYPDRLLADVISPELAQAIAVIEHLGLSSLEGQNGAYLMDSVLVILGTNQERSYAYSRSSAGAKGMAQFIPGTYAMMAKRAELGLDPDFETGMADARNALKAMVAYLDAELASMPLSVRDLFYVDEHRVHEFLAAAYNGGGTRVRRAILMWGDRWSEPHAPRTGEEALATLRAETIEYVKKLRVVKDMLRKPLIAELASGAAPPAPREGLTKICFSDGCHWLALSAQKN